ncbi:methyl-CpG-binding domain-containing protein 4-like [Amaranthus tricolor]|uniref:methyl-CpG-binding domain-containing protein 4-like n=1 Tax=Amaranthus tricolor TaxID=29722 RepID=UPI00258584A5|nr:methyl-CpG-binding domain-containing protein 4-like [Amaranthus tricolor]
MSQPSVISSQSPTTEASVTSRTPAAPSTPASSKKPQSGTNTIGLYAVQCGECFKWRLISNEEEYEVIRCNLLEEPFTCSKKANVSCSDPADIEKDATRTWVIDKPNIPRTPVGFKRKLVLRRDFSKLDAHYVTPTGKKVRSTSEVSKYLEENPDIKGVSLSEFSFTVPKVVEDTIPKEILERKASARGDKKAKDAKNAES